MRCRLHTCGRLSCVPLAPCARPLPNAQQAAAPHGGRQRHVVRTAVACDCARRAPHLVRNRPLLRSHEAGGELARVSWAAIVRCRADACRPKLSWVRAACPGHKNSAATVLDAAAVAAPMQTQFPSTCARHARAPRALRRRAARRPGATPAAQPPLARMHTGPKTSWWRFIVCPAYIQSDRRGVVVHGQ